MKTQCDFDKHVWKHRSVKSFPFSLWLHELMPRSQADDEEVCADSPRGPSSTPRPPVRPLVVHMSSYPHGVLNVAIEKICWRYNSLRLSDAYMRRQTKPSLLRIMACPQFGAKPLSEQTLAYCQLCLWEYISVKFESKYKNFHKRKSI